MSHAQNELPETESASGDGAKEIVGLPPSESGKVGIFRQPPIDAMREARKAKTLARKAQVVHLAAGVRVYPDVAPGTGWILARDGYPNRYLRDRATAIQHWKDLTGVGP